MLSTLLGKLYEVITGEAAGLGATDEYDMRIAVNAYIDAATVVSLVYPPGTPFFADRSPVDSKLFISTVGQPSAPLPYDHRPGLSTDEFQDEEFRTAKGTLRLRRMHDMRDGKRVTRAVGPEQFWTPAGPSEYANQPLSLFTVCDGHFRIAYDGGTSLTLLPHVRKPSFIGVTDDRQPRVAVVMTSTGTGFSQVHDELYVGSLLSGIAVRQPIEPILKYIPLGPDLFPDVAKINGIPQGTYQWRGAPITPLKGARLTSYDPNAGVLTFSHNRPEQAPPT